MFDDVKVITSILDDVTVFEKMNGDITSVALTTLDILMFGADIVPEVFTRFTP